MPQRTEPAPGSHPATGAAEQARQLAAISERLRELLDRETAALAERRIGDLADGQAAKRALIESYAAAARAFAAASPEAQALPAPARAGLRAQAERLAGAAAANAKALQAAMRVNEQVLQAVVAAVGERSTPAAGYTRRGAPPRAANGGVPLALSCDQRL
jgi:hypothetical protein